MECPGWGPEELCREQLSAFGLRPLRPERDGPVSGGRLIDSLVVNRKKSNLAADPLGPKMYFRNTPLETGEHFGMMRRASPMTSINTILSFLQYQST